MRPLRVVLAAAAREWQLTLMLKELVPVGAQILAQKDYEGVIR